MTMRTLPLTLLSVIAAAGLAWGQPEATALTQQERALIDLIKSSSLSSEPGVELLAGLARLPDGTYGRTTIRRAIDNMDGFADTPDGTEEEMLALLDRWAAIDETLGKTKEIVKQGEHLTLRRDRAQALPFRGGELELGKDIKLRIRPGTVIGDPDVRRHLPNPDSGSYVRVDEIEGVRVEGGRLEEVVVYANGATPGMTYFVRGDELGVWRTHRFERHTGQSRAEAPAPETGDFEVSMKYGLKRLPLRAGPGAKNEAKRYLDPGVRVDVLSEADSPWWQVRAGRTIGFVHKDHLAPRGDKTRQGLTSRLTLASE